MPIDVDKLVPDKRLAILDGLLRGIQNAKKEEEARRAYELKNMLEQMKVQSLEDYRNRMANVAEQGVMLRSQEVGLKGEELGLRQAQTEADIAYKNAQLDMLNKKLQNDIDKGTIDKLKLLMLVKTKSPEYIENIRNIINNADLDRIEKEEKLKATLKQAVESAVMKEKFGYDVKLEELRHTGRMEEVQTREAGEMARAKLQQTGALERTLLKINADAEREVDKAKAGLEDKTFNSARSQYEKVRSAFETELQKASMAGLDKLNEDDQNMLISRSNNIMATYEALVRKYPDRVAEIIPPSGALIYQKQIRTLLPDKAKLTFFSDYALLNDNIKAILNLSSDISKMKRKDAETQLINNGFKPEEVKVALDIIFGERK